MRLLEGALPPAALAVVREAENGRGSLFLAEIVLAELLWLTAHRRVRLIAPAGVDELFHELRGREYLVRSHLSEEGWSWFRRIRAPERHDRIAAADPLARNVALLTNEEVLRSLEPLQTVWK